MTSLAAIPALADNPALSVQQVTEYLRVDRMTVQRWIKDGRFPAFRVGKEYRVRLCDLEAWMAAGGVGPRRGQEQEQ